MGSNCERRWQILTESMPTAKEETTALGKPIAKARPRQKPRAARQYADSERMYRVSLPRRDRERIEFYQKKWINSRRNKPQKRKTSSILLNSEPDGGRIRVGRIPLRSDKTSDHALQEYLETISKYNIVVQFGAYPREKSAILPNAVTCSLLCNTLLAACFEKAACMKTTDELHQKVRLTPRVPRVVLNSTSQYGPQDPQNQEARSSWKPSSDSNIHGETCNCTVDHRTAGIPPSAVEPQNTIRENRVKRLIEQFENQKVKHSLIQDLKQREKIKESQDLIADMNNTEKICENSSKQQCPDCNAFWEMCLKNACMTDVHIDKSTRQSWPRSRQWPLARRNHKGWRFGPSGSRQGHPRYTGAVTTEGCGRADQRQKWQSQDAMTHHPDSTTHMSSDKQNENNLLQLWKKHEIYAKSNGVRPRTTATSPQSLDTWWKTEAVESSTVLLKDRRCASMRSKCFRKTRQEKHGGHPTILSRWHADADYRKSLCDIGWREHHIRLYDGIALEKHIYKATRAERIPMANNWILTANSEEGTQPPLNQRPDFSSSEKRMQTIAWRALDKNPTKIQRYSSQSTTKTAKRATIWRPRRPSLRRWPEHRLEVLQTVAGKHADICVKLAGQLASSFVIVVDVGPNPLEDEQLGFSAFFKSWKVVFRLPGETSNPGVCEQYTHKIQHVQS